MQLKELTDWIQELGAGQLGGEEQLFFGRHDREIRRALVCWMSSVDALRIAVARKCELVLCHETVLYPNGAPLVSAPADYMTWETNRRRLELIEKGDLLVQRLHASLDRICIFDDFARKLGLGAPSADRGNLVRAYDIPPVRFDRLVERAKRAVGMQRLRVSPRAGHRMVRRVGLPWGGLGLFVNVGYPAALERLGCDCFICGEIDCYTMHFARDSGVLFIETSHDASENIGLRHFTGMAARRFPGVKFHCFANRVPWAVA